MTEKDLEIQELRRELDHVKRERDAAKSNIAALLWLNGNCEFCKYGRKEMYSGASRWVCDLGNGIDCRPEWRGVKEATE